MNIEKLYRPRKTRKARKFSKGYQTVDVKRHLQGEWLNQYNILMSFVPFVFFVFFVDKLGS